MILTRTILAIGIMLLTALCSEGQQPEHYVVLSAQEVNSIPNGKPDEVFKKTSWKPTAADIAGLEASLPQIAGLKAERWNAKVRIENPEKYFRQYLAVAVAGRNLIYVNASCEEPPPSWHHRLYVVVDGATCFWQALYDPTTKTFSHLTINARA
jgi:hypothetical protein